MSKIGFTQGITRNEKVRIAIEWLVISIMTAWLFYDSISACLIVFSILPLWYRFRKDSFVKKRKRFYAAQFREGLEILAAAVSAGFSVERGIYETYRDLYMIYGKDNEMMEELRKMMTALSMNRTIESLFFELSENSGLEDIQSFAQVLNAAKKGGGNLVEIMEHTADTIAEKEIVTREIEVLLAGKKYEQMIMSIIPFGIIAYIRAGTPGYFGSLYHTATGVAIMSACLCIYGLAMYLGNKVLNIEV